MIPPLDFGFFSFAAPMALLGLSALPLVLWLLRLTPPSPKRQSFPPLRLLYGLRDRAQHAARTPPWLLILRMAALALLFLGLARPLIAPEQRAIDSAPLLIVIDNGWHSAPGWNNRQNQIKEALDRAAKAQRPVAVMVTAPTANGAFPPLPTFGAASHAQRLIQSLTPHPWPTTPARAEQLLGQAEADGVLPRPMDVIWFTDAVAPSSHQDGAAALVDRLQHLGALTIVPPNTALDQPIALWGAERATDGLTVRAKGPGLTTLNHPEAQGQAPADTAPGLLGVRAVDDLGAVLGVGVLAPATDTTGQPIPGEAHAQIALPNDAVRSVARLELVYPDGRAPGAGGVLLLDNRWRKPPVGLIAQEQSSAIPLLRAKTYLATALGAASDLRSGSLGDLLKQPIGSLLIPDSPDSTQWTPEQQATLVQWIQQGGIAIRFAGPHLAAADMALEGTKAALPVRLRQGGRTLGGILSWSKPAHLASFSPQGPLADLPIPRGNLQVDVSSQVLADPVSASAAQIWARLDDGTPLISALPLGAGWAVLIHTSADPSWSNLPLSGVFPDILDRLTGLAGAVDHPPGPATIAPAAADGPQAILWPAQYTLDGLGRLGAPSATVQPLELSAETEPNNRIQPMAPSPSHPPGLYGGVDLGDHATLPLRTVNIGTGDLDLTPVTEWPSGVQTGMNSLNRGPLDLGPWLLAGGLLLLWCDGLLSLWLRGLLGRRERAITPHRGLGKGRETPPPSVLSLVLAVTALSVGVGTTTPSQAQSSQAASESAPLSADHVAHLLEGRLAYVQTGDPAQDALSRAALTELTTVLRTRTSIELGAPQGVTPQSDDLTFFPVLYWPAVAVPPSLDRPTQQKIQSYRSHGGLIIFDAPAGLDGQPATDRLRQTLQAVGIRRLTPMPADHLLTRTFYLTTGLPGRVPDGQVWIEPAAVAAEDGSQKVSTVIAGTTDWAGAWALDGRGRPLLPLLGGQNRGREMAYRAGVNMVVYALTGTYKSDQVHVRTLLDRLHNPNAGSDWPRIEDLEDPVPLVPPVQTPIRPLSPNRERP